MLHLNFFLLFAVVVRKDPASLAPLPLARSGQECPLQIGPPRRPIFCVTEGHHWRDYKPSIDKIPDMADNMAPSDGKPHPVLHVGYFRSQDKKLHVTIIDANGVQQFNNNGDFVEPLRILVRNPPYEPDDFSYAETLPGTMRSSYYEGYPELTFESLVIAVEDGNLVYFGMVPGRPIYGKIVQETRYRSGHEPEYEMIYWHENQEKRTKNYWVLITNACKHNLELLGF